MGMSNRPHRLDLAGQKFGRLTVSAETSVNSRGEIHWRCQCDCGNERFFRANHLRSGRATSCGCSRTKHGLSRTPTYRSWDGMWQRCYNPMAPDYDRYGGRGIKVCDRWEDFSLFLADMGERPKGTTLDRRDNAGNYGPANCRWATRVEQQGNRHNSLIVTAFGQTKPLTQWAREFGMSRPETIRERLLSGWTPEDAVSKPSRKKAP